MPRGLPRVEVGVGDLLEEEVVEVEVGTIFIIKRNSYYYSLIFENYIDKERELEAGIQGIYIFEYIAKITEYNRKG